MCKMHNLSLKKYMLFVENEVTELKSKYTDNIKKEIIAFANTREVTIYIGINDDGSVCGGGRKF